MSSHGTKNERELREREGDPLTVILPPPESPHLESPVCLHICRWHELLRSYCMSESLTARQLYGCLGLLPPEELAASDLD